MVKKYADGSQEPLEIEVYASKIRAGKKKAEDNKKSDAERLKEVVGAGREAESTLRGTFAKLPADFLIINDLIFENVPSTAVSVQSEADVFVAETLRTSTPIIESKGRGSSLVSIQLLFKEGFEQKTKLRRLMAVLLSNPFVFVENNKIRQTIHAPLQQDFRSNDVSIETMAFVLHFGSMSVSDQMQGVITLDLQLAEFNYKPFSHHFWYSHRVHGIEVKNVSGVTVIDKEGKNNKKPRQPKMFPYDNSFESYDYSERAIKSVAADTMDLILEKSTKAGVLNSPVIFPAQSPAFLYYAQHLEDKMPKMGSYNSDYLRFSYKEYDIKTPPEDARSDTSTLNKFFSAALDEEDPLWDRGMGEWSDDRWNGKNNDAKTGSGTKVGGGVKAGAGRVTKAKSTSSRKYVKSVTKTTGGGKLYAAAFHSKSRQAPVYLNAGDRLWLARMLCGEMHDWSEKSSSERKLQMSFMAWTMMNRFMTNPKWGSFVRCIREFSQPLKGVAIQHRNTRDKFDSATKGKQNQLLNQYKAVTATWPGGDSPRQTGAGPSVIPVVVADFVNQFAAGKIKKPEKAGGRVGNIDDYKDWGKLKANNPFSKGFWSDGDSGDHWLYNNFAAEYFAFGTPNNDAKKSSKYKNYAPGQVVFKNGELYVRDRDISVDDVRSVGLSGVVSDVPCDSTIFVLSNGINVPDIWGTPGGTSGGNSAAIVAGIEAARQQEKKVAADEPTEQEKQKDEQPNNDQATGEIETSVNEEDEQDEVSELKKAQERHTRRLAWLSEKAGEGWMYHSTDKAFKNLFYKEKTISIGGDPNNGSLANIVPTAASIQFGHRLAKHKILGQPAPTWQFLGAGNKSGVLVFTAAGDEGRKSLQQIKSMYATLNYNARTIDLVRGSSSAKIWYYPPDSAKANNIFALSKIENINITNISSESVIRDGVDVYRMTIEFMAQDFVEPDFTPRNFIHSETKNAILSRMLGDLQAVDRKPGKAPKPLLNEESRRIVCLGDSITAFTGKFYGDVIADKLNNGSTVEAMGYANQGTGVIKGHVDEALAKHPTDIIVLAGVNDLGAYKKTTKNLGEMYDKILDAGVRLTAVHILPWRGWPKATDERYAGTQQVNQWIDLHLNLNKAIVATSLMGNSAGYLNPKYTKDGLHPNKAGHEVLGNLIYAKSFKNAPALSETKVYSTKSYRANKIINSPEWREKMFKKAAIWWNHTHPIMIALTSKSADKEDAKREEFLNSIVDLMHTLEEQSQNHYIRPSTSLCQWDDDERRYIARGSTPQWYVDILFDLSGKISNTSRNFPILNLNVENADYLSETGDLAKQDELLKQQGKNSDTWEDRIRKYGDAIGGDGNHFVELIGGTGVEAPSGQKIKGYVIPTDVVVANRKQDRLFESLLRQFNFFTQRALRKADDQTGFVHAFGTYTYQAIIESVLTDLGECYKDLDLPKIPSTDIPVVPEFYLYDDSLENASLAQLTTGTGGLAAAIKQHVENQVKSTNKFISHRMMGGFQVSKNAPRIADIRRGYASPFSDESRFLGATGGFAGMSFAGDKTTAVEEALRTFDVMTYKLASDTNTRDQEAAESSSGTNASDWLVPALNEFSEFEGFEAKDEPTKAFLTAVVSSAYLNKYNSKHHVTEKMNDKATLYGHLREYYFNDQVGKLPKQIYRGPSVLNTNVDDNWGGKITLDATVDLGELSDEEIPKNSLKPLVDYPQPQAQAEDGGTVLIDAAEQTDIKNQEEDLTIPPEEIGFSNPNASDDIVNAVIETPGRQEFYAKYKKSIDANRKLNDTPENQEYIKRVENLQKKDKKYKPKNIREKEESGKEVVDHYLAKVEAQLKGHLGKLHDMFKDVDDMDKQANRLISEATRRVKKDISMRRAYPTFKIFFIDEDTESEGLSGFHAFDDFYSYSSVQEIKITRSRKLAADLAVIRLTDVAHKLTMGRFGDVEIDKDDLKREDPLGWWAETLKENPFNGAILQEGVKVQIRLGYSNDPEQLETTFLGQIVEIAPSSDGKILEIVCQGYGAELEAASMDNIDEELVYYSSQHALSSAIMQPCVQNFGHWSFNQEYNPAQIRSRYQAGGESPFEITWLQDATREYTFRRLRHKNFRNNPEDDNIFTPPPWTYAGAWRRFWNNAVAFRPLMQTPWEVFKEHELRHPGYVALALPYGHEPRMTMFFGARGQNYWSKPPGSREIALSKYWSAMVQKHGGKNIINNYHDDSFRKMLDVLKRENPDFFKAFLRSLMPNNMNGIGYYIGGVHGRYRPFRNYHIFTSEHHIIQNEIRSGMSNAFNAVEIRFADSASFIEGTNPQEVAQKMKGVEQGGGGVLTVQLNDNIPEHQVRTYEGFYPSCVTEWMARRYAQGLLIQGLKESYTGTLTVTGEETIKPYDIVMVRDHITDMYGPIEVESVTHIFNRETGFCSVITPDLCVDSNDWFSKGWMDTINHVLSLVYEMAEQEKVMNTHREIPFSVGGSFDNFLGKLASFQVVHWDQTASPVCVTPLIHGGKPLMSITTAPKFASVFSNVWGKWHQWWEDFRVGWELGGVSEEFELIKDDLFDTFAKVMDAEQGGSRREKEKK